MLRKLIESIENDIEKIDNEISRLISARQVLYSDKKQNNDFCEKCNDGYIRKPMNIDFDSAVPASVQSYPALCECVSSPQIDNFLMELYEKKDEKQKRNRTYISHRAYIAHRLGVDYADKTVETFNPAGNSDAIMAFQKWIENPKTPCFLFGKTSAGKTHLIAGAANYFAQNNIPFAIVKGGDLDALTDRDRYTSAQRESKIHRLSKIKILIIDDLGVSRLTPARHTEVWYPLLDTRRNNRLPTLYSADVMVYPTKARACVWGDYEDNAARERLITRMVWGERNAYSMQLIPLKRT
jgi:DNA replication protein DnaC